MINEKDLTGRILYEDPEHKFIWLGGESKYRKGVIQTMQYLIIDNGRGTLLDPGGSTPVFAGRRIGQPIYLHRQNRQHILFSPGSGRILGNSALARGNERPKSISQRSGRGFSPTSALSIPTGLSGSKTRDRHSNFSRGNELKFVPAHFMHSPGHFSLFDVRSRILFYRRHWRRGFPGRRRNRFRGGFRKTSSSHRRLSQTIHGFERGYAKMVRSRIAAEPRDDSAAARSHIQGRRRKGFFRLAFGTTLRHGYTRSVFWFIRRIHYGNKRCLPQL